MESNKRKRISDEAFKSKFTKILFCFVIPPVLVAAIVITAIWGGNQRANAESYRSAAQSVYEQAYNDLVTTIYDMNVDLAKLTAMQSPASVAYTLDDIWRASGVCIGLMGQIPQSHVDSLGMNQFIIRLGDYARTLSLSSMKGRSLSDEDRNQLEQLRIAGENLYHELQYVLSQGIFPNEAMQGEAFYSSGATVDADGNEIDEFTSSVEDKYPTLIYDGPFSESTEKMEPRGLSGDNLDEHTALMKAYEYVGGENVELRLDSMSDGRIPSYDFSGRLGDGRSVDISVSVQGGSLVWFRTDVTDNIEGLPSSEEEAQIIETCKSWLHAHGYDSMEPTYAQYYSGTALINFAYEAEEVIIYNDLVKIYVDRKTMSVCGFDARNYLFSHTDRSIPTETLSEEEVRSRLPESFQLQESNLALIPATPQTEVLCYEFKGSIGENSFAIYLDAQTGDEVKVFMIISDDHGQLAI